MATKSNGDQLLAPEKQLIKPPPLYKVILLNDDYTPMDFVIVVLQTIFHWDFDSAKNIMLQVHEKGRGVCGVFSKDVAETKVAEVSQFAKQHQHPLQCVMEES